LEDIENKILKITDSDTFSDDPLRILRGIQFIGRFDLLLDLDSAEIIKSMLPSLQELAKERI
jgi:tRNA nucleotidyltransferase (CCA-adding enzyme)